MHQPATLTLDEVRTRIAVAGLRVPEARHEMVRRLLGDALAPMRRMDPRALATLEPAVTFDAAGAAGARDASTPAATGATPAAVAATLENLIRAESARVAAALAERWGVLGVPGAEPGGAADEVAYLTIAELGRRYRRRALSPVEVTTALLQRIERLDPKLHAFVTLTADRALADAKAAEAALVRGDAGPLAGIPIAYKDLYATRGVLTTAGSAVLADWVPAEDSTCVARLQAAGCVLLGKLITHEFAFGIQFPGHRFLAARNPWNLDHIPGGSSSGSGAALAAGLVAASLGSDTGGSIRGPAAQCGIVGLKPTYGRCSRAGVVTLSWTLDHTGPMARTVEDSALLLQALAGHDPMDPASSRAPVADYVTGLADGVRGLRVGVPRAYFLEGAHPEVGAAFEAAVETLRGLGARVVDVTIPSIWDAPAFMAIMLAEAFAYHERDLRERPELYGEVLREKLQAGGLVTSTEYVQAQRLRARLHGEMLSTLATVDVLATPTIPAPAASFSIVLDPDFPFPKSNMAPFNMGGLPALALPCGFSSSGLPLSLQIAGRPFDESTVLRVGHAYERATAWHARRPPV